MKNSNKKKSFCFFFTSFHRVGSFKIHILFVNRAHFHAVSHRERRYMAKLRLKIRLSVIIDPGIFLL
jgi:hypothetical protein